MTDDKNRLLSDLEQQIHRLMFLCDSLKRDKTKLQEELDEVKSQLDSTVGELDILKAKYDSLKNARTITAATVDIDMAEEKLSTLVREIDKCINLLS